MITDILLRWEVDRMINDGVRNKADDYKVDSLNSKIDSLERSINNLDSSLVNYQHEINNQLNEMDKLKIRIEELENNAGG